MILCDVHRTAEKSKNDHNVLQTHQDQIESPNNVVHFISVNCLDKISNNRQLEIDIMNRLLSGQQEIVNLAVVANVHSPLSVCVAI